MKYAISVIPESEGSNDVSLSLDTTEGAVEIKSYGVILNLQEFIEFADGVQEIRRKLEVLTLKNNTLIFRYFLHNLLYRLLI